MDKLRKNARLSLSFARTASFNLFFLTVVTTIIFCILTLAGGKLAYFSDSYVMFDKADIADDIYFSMPMRSMQDIPALRSALLETDGVTGLIDGPISRKIELRESTPDNPLFQSFLRYEEPLYEKFTPRLVSGKGFDYSTDKLECIITDRGSVDGHVRVGDKLTFGLHGSKKELVLTVAGIAEANRLYPLMNGGGSLSAAELIAGQTDLIIVKDSPKTAAALDDVIGGRHASAKGGVFSTFIETDDTPTDEERETVFKNIAAVSDKSSEQNLIYGKNILEHTKANLAETIKQYTPLFVFMAVFFVTTVVCIVTLSVYRYAASYALYRMLGGTERGVVMTICSAFFSCIALAFLITFALLHIVINTHLASNEMFETTLLTTETLLLPLLAAVLTSAAAALITKSAAAGQKLRALSGKYTD